MQARCVVYNLKHRGGCSKLTPPLLSSPFIGIRVAVAAVSAVSAEELELEQERQVGQRQMGLGAAVRWLA